MIELEISDMLSIVSMFVNSILVFILATTIQKNILNSRTLKDYFINETKQLNNNYLKFILKVENGEIYPKDIDIWFNNNYINNNNLCDCLNEKYKIDKRKLIDFLNELHVLFDNDENYKSAFKQNSQFFITKTTLEGLEKFKLENFKIFHNIIISINDFTKNTW